MATGSNARALAEAIRRDIAEEEERTGRKGVATLAAKSGLTTTHIYQRLELRYEVSADLLNASLTPLVNEYGSLGCSGDLAPLASCALVLMGEGMVQDASGHVVPAGEALVAAGCGAVVLEAKEGLALLNGTDGMLGMLVGRGCPSLPLSLPFPLSPSPSLSLPLSLLFFYFQSFLFFSPLKLPPPPPLSPGDGPS